MEGLSLKALFSSEASSSPSSTSSQMPHPHPQHQHQGQKMFDLKQFDLSHLQGLPGGGGGGGGGGSTGSSIERILLSFDQEDLLVAALNQHFYQPITLNPTNSSSNSGSQPQIMISTSPPQLTPVTTAASSTSSTTLGLDPNIVLQNFEMGDVEQAENTGGKGRPYVCTRCPASYKTRTHLRRHMMIHMNNRPYHCSDCGKGFNRKEHLNKHIEAVHSLTKHKCEVCNKEISRRDHLSRHIKNMHPSHAALLQKDELLGDNTATEADTDGDPSILKISVPCAQKQKAQLTFLTPTTTTSSVSVPISVKLKSEEICKDKDLEEVPADSSKGNSIIKIRGITDASVKNDASSPDETEESSSNSNPNQVVEVQNVAFTLSSVNITNIELNLKDQVDHEQMEQIIFNRNEISSDYSSEQDDDDDGSHNHLNLDPESFQQVLDQLTPTRVTSALNMIKTTTSPNISTISTPPLLPTMTNSSPQKPITIAIKDSPSNSNGLVSLANLSLTLGGQIKEAPFANCSEPKKPRLQPPETLSHSCTECSAKFPSEKDLIFHMRSHKPQNYRCPECPRAYTRREKLTEHIRCFHEGQKFKCQHCNKELSRKDHVLRHVRSIHPELLTRFSITELHDDMNMMISVIPLENDAHSQESLQPQNTNPKSSSSTSSTPNLNSSTLNGMSALLRSICQYCHKCFGTAYHLSRHVESCHNGDIRPFPCPSCSKQFKRKDHLTKHIKSHCPNVKDAVASPNNLSTNSKSPTKTSKNRNTQNSKTKNGHVKTKAKEKSSTPLEKSVNNSLAPVGNPQPQLNTEQHTLSMNAMHLDDIQESMNNIKDSAESEFNLAMINSFIAENVNVVVEEEDLTSLLHSHEHQQHSNSQQSPPTDNENAKSLNVVKTSLSPKAEDNSHCQSQMTTFPCGHCQKEFSSRDSLLEHLQDHNNDERIGGHRNQESSSRQIQGLRSVQFSNY